MSQGISEWKILNLLSRGSHDDVYRIRIDDGVICAGKYIRLPIQEDESDSEGKLRKKVETMQYLLTLHHENLVKVRDVKMLANEHTVVVFMDLIKGRRLSTVIEQNGGALMEDRIRRYSQQICSVLKYLHHVDNNVLHRIISSSSVMITESDEVKLVDYGTSIYLLGATSVLRSECPRGLPQYMAPELLNEDASCKYSSRTDIWAFGCVVYEMATGKRPHDDCQNMLAIVQRVQRQGAPSLPDACSDSLKSFYAACVAKDGSQRMSAAELLDHEFLAL